MDSNKRSQFSSYLAECMGTATNARGIFTREARWLNVAIPLRFCFCDGRMTLSAFPELVDKLPELPENSTPETALKQLLPVVTAYMKPHGYIPMRHTADLIDVFTADKEPPVITCAATPQQLNYETIKALLNPTRITLTESYFTTRTAYGIVDEKTLVSVAAVNLQQTATAVRDLCVETLPAYRGRGYAAVNTAALLSALLRDDKLPLYRCRRSNASSEAVARQLRLSQIAVSCRMTFTRESDD